MLLGTERVLTQERSSETKTYDILRDNNEYDITFVVSLKDSSEEGIVTMDYVVLMTSRRELFPKLTLDVRLRKKSPSSSSLSSMNGARKPSLPDNGEAEQDRGRYKLWLCCVVLCCCVMLWCCVVLRCCLVLCCCVRLCYVTSRHVTLRYVALRCVMLLCYVTLRYVVLCCVVLLSYVVMLSSSCVVLCCAVLYFAVCCDMLCFCFVLRFVVLLPCVILLLWCGYIELRCCFPSDTNIAWQ